MSLLLPLRYPAMLYSNSDTDAPLIANADGAIKTILKACLVTGYGTKPAAGWSMLFEDVNRIVLRLPSQAQALGLPDLKFENGEGKYRIVSQKNPTGLDDANQIASTPLLSRDSFIGQAWHLIATDIGFVFWYQAGEDGLRGNQVARSVVLLCSASSVVVEADSVAFLINVMESVNTTNGKASPWIKGFLHSSTLFKNMRDNTTIDRKSFMDLGGLNPDDDVFQQVLIGRHLPPICASLSSDVKATPKNITVNNRVFIRVPDDNYQRYTPRDLYIPIDYWEL